MEESKINGKNDMNGEMEKNMKSMVEMVTTGMERMSASMSRLNDEVNKLSEQLNEATATKKETNEKIEEVGKTASLAYEIATGTEKRLENMENRIKELDYKLKESEDRNNRSIAKINSMESRENEMDNRLRRNRIIITNLPEGREHDLRKQVFGLLKFVHEQLVFDDLDIVARIGENGRNHGRWKPVLVSFVYEETRNAVLWQKRKLNSEKGRMEHPHIWMQEDANQETRRNLSEMVKVQKLARGTEEYRDTRLRGNSLLINGQVYDRNHLDKLPEKLRLANTNTEHGETYVAFAGEYAPLSNMYRQCNIKHRGYTFSSAEQQYTWIKAGYAKDERLQRAILQENNPFTCKRMVQHLRPRGWEEVEHQIMEQCLMDKFGSTRELGERLRNTGNKRLIEATRSRYWGANVAIGSYTEGKRASEIFKAGSWTGRNIMGNILEKVRGRLFKEPAGKQQSQQEQKKSESSEVIRENQNGVKTKGTEEEKKVPCNNKTEITETNEQSIVSPGTSSKSNSAREMESSTSSGPRTRTITQETFKQRHNTKKEREIAAGLIRDRELMRQRELTFIHSLERNSTEVQEENEAEEEDDDILRWISYSQKEKADALAIAAQTQSPIEGTTKLTWRST